MRKMQFVRAAVFALLSACATSGTPKVPMICDDQDAGSMQTLMGGAIGGGGAAFAAHRFIGKGNGKIAATAGAGLIGALLGAALAAPSPKCYPDPRYLPPLNPQGSAGAPQQDQRPKSVSVIDPTHVDEQITLVPNFLTQINLPDRETVNSVNVGNRDIVDIQFRYNYISIKPTEPEGATNIIVHSIAPNNTLISRQFVLTIKPQALDFQAKAFGYGSEVQQ